MKEGKLTLDRDVFKALASDTRLDVLQRLDARRMTVSELARSLDLNKATVYEHVKKLDEVGLVERLEDHRKWVYYQLTWKGRRLLHPERVTLAVLLSSSGASLVTGLAALWMYLSSLPKEASNPTAESAPMIADSAPQRAAEAAAGDATLLWAAVVLLVVCALLAAGSAWVFRELKKKEQGAPARSA